MPSTPVPSAPTVKPPRGPHAAHAATSGASVGADDSHRSKGKRVKGRGRAKASPTIFGVARHLPTDLPQSPERQVAQVLSPGGQHGHAGGGGAGGGRGGGPGSLTHPSARRTPGVSEASSRGSRSSSPIAMWPGGDGAGSLVGEGVRDAGDTPLPPQPLSASMSGLWAVQRLGLSSLEGVAQEVVRLRTRVAALEDLCEALVTERPMPSSSFPTPADRGAAHTRLGTTAASGAGSSGARRSRSGSRRRTARSTGRSKGAHIATGKGLHFTVVPAAEADSLSSGSEAGYDRHGLAGSEARYEGLGGLDSHWRARLAASQASSLGATLPQRVVAALLRRP